MIDKQNKEMQELQNAYRLQKMEFEQISGNLERLQQEFTAKTQEIKVIDFVFPLGKVFFQ